MGIFGIFKSKNNRLIHACTSGNLKKVAKLVKKNEKHFNLSFALLIACEFGHYEIVKLLIEKGGDININIQYSTKWESANAHFGAILLSEPPITIAARNGHKEIVELLLSFGANFNATSNNPSDYKKSGWEAVPSSKETAVRKAAEFGYYDIVLTLLKAGAHPNLNWKGGSIWEFAIIRNNLDLAELIINNCLDINIKGQRNETLLHGASAWGQPKIVELLIKKGADINARNDEGETALYRVKNVVTAKLLINSGADILSIDRFGATPLHHSILLLEADVAKLLIDSGADIHTKNRNGESPLHKASYYGQLEIVKYLIDKGADIHARDNEGKTPLHACADSRDENYDVVELLIERGANINAKTDKGETALKISIGSSNKAISELLKAKGAK